MLKRLMPTAQSQARKKKQLDFEACLAGDRSSSAMVLCHLNIQSLLPKRTNAGNYFRTPNKTSPLIRILNVGDVVD